MGICWGMEKTMETTIRERQLENQMEHAKETLRYYIIERGVLGFRSNTYAAIEREDL